MRRLIGRNRPSVYGGFAALLICALTTNVVADQPSPNLQQVYHVTFGGGSLDSGVDPLQIGLLKAGDAQVSGSNPVASVSNGYTDLSVTRPSGASGIVSSGLYATPIEFGPGSVFRVQATFEMPPGPSTGGWASAVSARTGGVDDLAAEMRVVAGLSARPNGTARLNVPFGAQSSAFVDIPQDLYNDLFHSTHHQKYTIALLVDRRSGMGKASLFSNGSILSVDFVLSQFKATSGPVITAAGAAVANGSATGATVSVRVTDFRLFADRPEACRLLNQRCLPGSMKVIDF